MSQPTLNLVASTENPDGTSQANRSDPRNTKDPFFKSVQWAADGTTLFTSSSTNHISSFVLPESLLDPSRTSPLTLAPQATISLPEPTSAIAPCPYFALENPSTQVLLTACTDHPIHLHHIFPPSNSASPPPIASFRLIKHETEAYLPVASLIWPSPGTHFIAGTTHRIALWDVSRPDAGMSAEPVVTIPTIPSTRYLIKGGGVGMRGTVSSMALQSAGQEGLLAAGTWTRWIGLYDLTRAGNCVVANWGVKGAADETGIEGKGIVQTVWSPCGRYLVVNERGSGGMLVYDLRGTNKLLGVLKGRDGYTNQRLSCDVFPGTEEKGGFEVWAGTREGGVVVYEGVGMSEGDLEPVWGLRAAHGSAVGSAAMHLSGSVLATCSGSWAIVDESGSESESDSGSESGSDEDSDEESGGSESESESESESGSEASLTVKRPKSGKSRIVVGETSLKVWSIGPSSSEHDHEEERDDDNRDQ
ncbi:hypothetical protein QBC43DRAFT_358709 [Cladorrhinum sp. PSN259]|nr:hypothetical protein QBC43DRAFT_358709 [Cladorrhinum sp. PSN259]